MKQIWLIYIYVDIYIYIWLIIQSIDLHCMKHPNWCRTFFHRQVSKMLGLFCHVFPVLPLINTTLRLPLLLILLLPRNNVFFQRWHQGTKRNFGPLMSHSLIEIYYLFFLRCVAQLMFLILLGFLLPLLFPLGTTPSKPRNVPVIGLFAKDIGVIEAGELGARSRIQEVFQSGPFYQFVNGGYI